MNFFKKISGSIASPNRGNANCIIETLYDKQGTKGLAFGLQWRPIVTSGGRDAAEKIARTGGGTHYIFRGQQLGYGAVIAVKNGPAMGRLFSASAVLARQHVGDSVYAVRVGPGEYWIASTRNASPTSDDKFFVKSNDADALAATRDILAKLEADGAKPDVYTNIDNNGFDNTKLISVEDILAAALISDDLLIQLPKQKATIPVPLLIVAVIAILAMGGQAGYKWWDAKERAKQAALNQQIDEDPAVAWERTITTWQSSVAAPDFAGLTTVRNSLTEVPVRWDGWVIGSATCIAGVINSVTKSERPWACSATYNREVGGKLTREINNTIPANWTVAYTPLNQMIVSWQVKQQSTTIDISKLSTATHHKIETTSRLQKLEQAFTQPVTFAFTPVEITPPKRADGSAYQPIPAIEGLAQAPLSIRAPLRTIDAVLNVNLDVSWSQLTLTYSALGNQPTISSSMLSSEATGVLYAKK